MKQHIKIKHTDCVEAEFEALKQRKKERKMESIALNTPRNAKQSPSKPGVSTRSGQKSKSSRVSRKNSTNATPNTAANERGKERNMDMERPGSRKASELYKPNEFFLEAEGETNQKPVSFHQGQWSNQKDQKPLSLFAFGNGLHLNPNSQGLFKLFELPQSSEGARNDLTTFQARQKPNEKEEYTKNFSNLANRSSKMEQENDAQSWANVNNSFANLSISNETHNHPPQSSGSAETILGKIQTRGSETTASMDEENSPRSKKVFGFVTKL